MCGWCFGQGEITVIENGVASKEICTYCPKSEGK